MKRIICILQCMLFVTSLLAQTTFIENGINYSVNPNEKDIMVVASDAGYSGAVKIPAKVTHEGKTYTVTHIGKNAFLKSGITSITLPEGLIEIGEAAFRECQSLKAITIPASVVNIENEAFIFSYSLSNLTFMGKTRPLIGSYAFGKTQIKLQGINTGIPANMAEPSKDSRYKISNGYIIY